LSVHSRGSYNSQCSGQDAVSVAPAAALAAVLDERQIRGHLRDGVTVTAVLTLAAERSFDLA
jgi:hypothetical protein